ncbi:MAG: UvrD-helicase domain-containing protein [Candidatus Dojkabacteria bacterium]|nr:MAG: UvrD-helicase domain-containing protein [Candidatus Dojkabacteria bacterium]
MTDIFETLNEQQRLAVQTTSGPVLILAGAGSGKTRVLTFRMYYLLKKAIARPENILAVTFTNKAADEMKERISDLLKQNGGAGYALPWVGTFHSICVKILRVNYALAGISPEFSIYDRADQIDAVKEAMRQLGIDSKYTNPNAVINYISSAKAELVGPQSYSEYALNYFEQQVAKIYPEYQKILKSNNALDFDDLIMRTVNLLQDNPAVLSKYQDLFTHIMVDEYQDTNKAQYVLVNLLAFKHKNICVVGDDAQSIYSFRGANITNILNFEKDYPNATIIKLEQNYRSTGVILDASNSVIKHNKNKKEKTLWTKNIRGEEITVYEAADQQDEAKWVANKILNLDSKDIAVLYRTNAQSRALEEVFLREGISYTVVGSTEFYKRKEIKDIMAYLRLIFNNQDDLSLKRIINVPRRKIGSVTLANLQKEALTVNLAILPYLFSLNESELRKWGVGVSEFCHLLKKMIVTAEQQTVSVLLEDLIEFSGYKSSLSDGSNENEQRLENIRELITVARNFDEFVGRNGLELFLENISLIEGYNRQDDDNNPTVKLMTVHAAKGLEFQHTFIVGLEEGIFPHSNSYMDPEQMEEERRLAYVAITRAKERLYLVYADSRIFYGKETSNPASRFISDIPSELLSFEDSGSNMSFSNDWSEVVESHEYQEENRIEVSIGDMVYHDIFGKGRILDFDDSTLLIEFSSGRKELSREFAKLKKI